MGAYRVLLFWLQSEAYCFTRNLVWFWF